jgi:hypothetical protein
MPDTDQKHGLVTQLVNGPLAYPDADTIREIVVASVLTGIMAMLPS